MSDILLYDARDVQRVLRVGRSRAYAIMRELPRVVGLGHSERVPRWAVEAWVREHTTPASSERPCLEGVKGRPMESGDAENEMESTTPG
jgi:hypothetical protein